MPDEPVGDGCAVCRQVSIVDDICQRCRETLIHAESSYAKLDSAPQPETD